MDLDDPSIVAVVVDEANSRILAFKHDVLINQISRDAARIATSFDTHHSGDILTISRLFATISALLTSGLLKATRDDDELRLCCGEVLSNSLNSIAAAALLLRSGFVLQPGILLRTTLEQIAVVLHLMQYQNEVDAYKSANFDSTRAIKSAKNAFPEFGKLYGVYSKEFSHIGQLHKQVTPIRDFVDPTAEEAEANLSMIRTLTWMSYVTAELVFLDLVYPARYWTIIEIDQPDTVAYKFEPSENERVWMSHFLSLDAP